MLDAVSTSHLGYPPDQKSPNIGVRLGFICRIPEGKRPSRIGTGNAHEREMTDVYAAEFPSICSSGDSGRNARHGANAFGGRAGRQRNAQRRIDSGLFTGMDSSLLSLVRAARIGGWPDHQFVPLGGAGGRGSGRFAGFASQQGWDQQLRPTGRGLQKSDPTALGGRRGQAIRRNIACRRYLSEPFEPVLALANAFYLQAADDADDSAAGQDHDLVRWLQ